MKSKHFSNALRGSSVYIIVCRPVTSLGHQEGRRVFREGPKFLELCPKFLNYVQHIFPGGAKNFLGALLPPAPPLVTSLIVCIRQPVAQELDKFHAQVLHARKFCRPACGVGVLTQSRTRLRSNVCSCTSEACK